MLGMGTPNTTLLLQRSILWDTSPPTLARHMTVVSLDETPVLQDDSQELGDNGNCLHPTHHKRLPWKFQDYDMGTE
jgi:hypothetical protein